MSDDRIVVMEITTIEAVHLADLVRQFRDLVSADAGDGRAASSDPAVARLAPDAYPSDPDASREFRRLTQSDLLRRREDDAAVLLRTLFPDGKVPDEAGTPESALTPLVVPLAHSEALSWMRTLAAVRLVLASRLGITAEDDTAADDPRYAVYEWVGMRLDGLVAALDPDAA